MILIFSCLASAEDDPAREDLAALQGKWTTQVGDDGGIALIAVKEIKGNTETYTVHKAGEVVIKREVDFKLSRLENRVRLLTVTRVVAVKGPDEGRSFDTDLSYLYKIEGDTIFEVEGLLLDRNLVGNSPYLITWQRVAGPKAAANDPASASAPEKPRAERGDSPHTFDGKYDLSTIDLTVAYLVPSDCTPLADWRERVDYFMGRIAAFHRRESGGRSALNIRVHPEPLIAGRTAREIRGDHPNQTFANSTREARTALGWPGKREGFPILLVLSEINWRELDDFQRTTLVDGVTKFEGTVDSRGRHFPGAESGGARATYRPDRGEGLGLVSADGWRVPYTGSDCVVYHEGIGHPIGLPHPEPIDDSVMGPGQYRSWLNRAWVDDSQKRALGWPARTEGTVAAKENGPTAAATDLFTAFTAVASPVVPKTEQPVKLEFHWPEGARLGALKVRIQTDVQGPWRTIPVDPGSVPPAAVDLGSFELPTPVSYRVDATLEDGQAVELWGYFQVKPRL